VALRKVLGATRGQLMTQFIGESILLAAIAMLVALALVELVAVAQRLPRCQISSSAISRWAG
jgi:putative ABC transport system permease protein